MLFTGPLGCIPPHPRYLERKLKLSFTTLSNLCLLILRQISVITKIQSRINLTLEVRGKTVQAQGPRTTVEILRHEFRYRLSSLLLLRLGENVGNFSHECPGT
jgi:hypothetical protein